MGCGVRSDVTLDADGGDTEVHFRNMGDGLPRYILLIFETGERRGRGGTLSLDLGFVFLASGCFLT